MKQNFQNLFALFFMMLLVFSSSAIYGQNNALHFDGVSDMVDCGNPSAVQITGTNLTLEAWIKADSWQFQVYQGNIINKEENGMGTDYGYMMRVGDNGKVNFNIGDGNWTELNTASVLNIGQWHHIACVYDGDSMLIYVDGIKEASKAASLLIENASANLTLGNQPGFQRYFNGAIDEVRICNIARTAAEIATNKDLEIATNTAGLVAYYQFNQGTANSDNTGITTLNDATTNAVDGTLMNFALTGTTSNWVDGAPIGAVSTTNLSSTGASINIFPNPVGDVLTLKGGTGYVIIYNAIGQPVLEKLITNDVQQISTTALPKGMYILRLQHENGQFSTKQFLK